MKNGRKLKLVSMTFFAMIDLVGQKISVFRNRHGEIVLKIGNVSCFLSEEQVKELIKKIEELV